MHGTGDKIREVPLHPQLRTDVQLWLDERPHWPGAGTTPALLLNRRGGRLSTRASSDIFRDIPEHADRGHQWTAAVGDGHRGQRAGP